MNVQARIELLTQLGDYMVSADPQWQEAKTRAGQENGWFIPESVDLAINNIADRFLKKDILQTWAKEYAIPDNVIPRKTVGIVMAGNIPLVGFHDLLCVLISGHAAAVKPSSKDSALIKHLVNKMIEWQPEIADQISFGEILKNCDAYIATGSNNSAGYFEYYFKKYPHIIRRNRTSVALLDGDETSEDLSRLADDVYQFFGRGCRNVTKVFIPEGYDFVGLLDAFKKYDWLADYRKYKNNYDYNLAIQLLNKKYYMSNASLLLTENPSPFSPIAQLNYAFYENKKALTDSLKGNFDIQCLVGNGLVPFGQSQSPAVDDWADGVDTLNFLLNL